MKIRVCFNALLCFVIPLTTGCAKTAPRMDRNAQAASTFTLWQLPNQTHSQIMSYVIRTAHNRIIVIDGGTTGDAGYLKGFLAALDNEVDAWFMSHAHDDHFGALTEILNQQNPPHIKSLYGSLPDLEWVRRHCSEVDFKVYDQFLTALRQANLQVTDLSLGTIFQIDGIRVEVLGVRNPELTANPINNSSLVWRMSDSTKSILFLGDLGKEGGQKLLESPYARSLHSDYVQMAHHGQNGVEEAFYQTVNPIYCLWPTPGWLWDNDSGTGKGSGPWQTLQVRAWMDRLPIRHHYVMANGLCRID